jgi:hypothetical protein
LLLAVALAVMGGLAVQVVVEQGACDQALRRSRLERVTQLQLALAVRLLVLVLLALVVIMAPTLLPLA